MAPTNWLLTNHPAVYLYGSLYEAGGFIDDGSDFEAKMKARRDEAMRAASALAGRSQKIGRLTVDPALLRRGHYDWTTDTILT